MLAMSDNKKNKPGRRKTKKSRTQQVLDDLPLGVRFIGRPNQYNESFFLRMQARSLKQSDEEKHSRHSMQDESEMIEHMADEDEQEVGESGAAIE